PGPEPRGVQAALHRGGYNQSEIHPPARVVQIGLVGGGSTLPVGGPLSLPHPPRPRSAPSLRAAPLHRAVVEVHGRGRGGAGQAPQAPTTAPTSEVGSGPVRRVSISVGVSARVARRGASISPLYLPLSSPPAVRHAANMSGAPVAPARSAATSARTTASSSI